MNKKSLLIMILILILSTPAHAIWLQVWHYRQAIAQSGSEECVVKEDCWKIIPVFKEAWVLHPHIVITRLHHKSMESTDIRDENGNKLRVYMFKRPIYNLKDPAYGEIGLIAYISDKPLEVEFTRANMVDYLHGQGVTMKDIYKIREFFINVLGEFENDKRSVLEIYTSLVK